MEAIDVKATTLYEEDDKQIEGRAAFLTSDGFLMIKEGNSRAVRKLDLEAARALHAALGILVRVLEKGAQQ